MITRRTSALIVFGLATVACSDPDAAETGKVSVGLAHPFTGPLATQGVAFEQAMLLAQDQINSHGGIRGKKLDFVAKDSQTNGDVARTAAQELVDNGVPAILTGDGTASAMAILDVAVPANVVVVVGTAQTMALARPENNGLFFRPGSTSFDEAGPLVSTVVADGYSKVAVISSTIPYAAGLYGEFEKAFMAAECEAPPCEITYHGTYPADADPESFDFSSLMDEALAGDPEALFFSAYPADGKAVLDAAWAAGYRGPIYISQAAGNENLAQFLPDEQATSIKWATLEEAQGRSADFVRDLWTDSGFRAEDFFGPVHSNFDAAFLLGLALSHANSSDGEALAESMREVANAPGEPIYASDWAKALDAIENGRDIDYVGVTSNVDFDDVGNNSGITSVIKSYRNGEPVIITHFE
jgi:ABC-type branched-subunit amino acid transport system substrate-binding protein